MKKIVFVCLGNICRSPMAELIFKDMAGRAGVEFEVTSRATGDDEVGNGIYPLAKAELLKHGITGEHRAQVITYSDIVDAYYVIGMDTYNMRSLHRIAGDRFLYKLKRLCDFTDKPRDVADPWYTRDFSKAYEDIYDGCKSLLEFLLSEQK